MHINTAAKPSNIECCFMKAVDKVMDKNKEDEIFKSEAGMMFG